ncbi:MAG: DNA-binding transcriptional LysR family regulator [Candidatus Endobugula sp.]|jgi:DNA-binding transcriptional LysR family regulator
MDTHLLHAFLIVADQQSFSLAAKHLSLTQPAVSKRIALLEEQLGTLLFDRIGRNIALTEAGCTLLPHAKRLVDDNEKTLRLMKDRQGTVGGSLRIATSHHIGVHRLPPFLKAYTQQYPEVYLQLHFIDSEQAIEAILQGEFDLALITLPEANKEDGSDPIQQHKLWHDPMHFVVGLHHPLYEAGSKGKTITPSITLQQLAEHPAILPDTNTRTTQLVKQLFSRKGLTPNITMTTNHLDAIKMMVGVGLGWSALPERLIDKSLYQLPIKKITLERELGCIHHRHRSLSNAARAMLGCLQAAK